MPWSRVAAGEWVERSAGGAELQRVRVEQDGRTAAEWPLWGKVAAVKVEIAALVARGAMPATAKVAGQGVAATYPRPDGRTAAQRIADVDRVLGAAV